MNDVNYQSVPWTSTAEWIFVRDALFSGISRKQRLAIARVDVWRCRAQRSLPVSIISTVDLMRLALLDEVVHLEPSPSNQVDDTHLRLAYSMALVRFVNLSTEILQKRTAQAVHMLAGDMGLPEWLVNIRHEATHYTLPSMDLLRNGASLALEWLKLTYWDEQSKDICLQPGYRAFGVDDSDALPSHRRDKSTRGEEEDEEVKNHDNDRGHQRVVVAPQEDDWGNAPMERASDVVVDWSRVPIGILPGQALTAHSLDLPDFVDSLSDGADVSDLPTLSYHWHEESECLN